VAGKPARGLRNGYSHSGPRARDPKIHTVEPAVSWVPVTSTGMTAKSLYWRAQIEIPVKKYRPSPTVKTRHP